MEPSIIIFEKKEGDFNTQLLFFLSLSQSCFFHAKRPLRAFKKKILTFKNMFSLWEIYSNLVLTGFPTEKPIGFQ